MEKTVFITGASGLVARYIISEILNHSVYDVVAVSSCPEIVADRYHNSEKLTSIGYDDFFAYRTVNQQEAGTSIIEWGGVIC